MAHQIRNSTMLELEQHAPVEELVNAVTHGVGAVLAIAALAVLVTFAALAGDSWRVVSFSIYGATLVLMYLASTFYHAASTPRLKALFRIFDHSAIYLLIAGTYTPIMLVTLGGGWGWSLFGVTWGMAALGIAITAWHMERLRLLGVLSYIVMGWLAVIAVKPLLTALPVGGLVWLLAGGLAYTLGIFFYAYKRIPFHHGIWHLFVLGGSVSHFCTMLFYVLPVTA